MLVAKPNANPLKDLGKIAIDAVTGFTGTVVSIVFQLDGNVQYCVTPNVKDENSPYPDSIALDKNVVMIDPEDPGITDLAVKSQAPIFSFGDKVQDIITDDKGIVTQRAVYLSGCTFFCVENKKKSLWINQNRLKLLEHGLIEKSDQSSGGPTQRITSVKR